MKKRILILFAVVSLLLLFLASPVTAAPLLKIGNVTFTENEDGSYKVSWRITGASESLNVRVYLSVSDHDYKANNVELGSIRSGSAGSLTVRIPDVDSGYYHFMIGVTTMSGTVTYAFSGDALFYDNPLGAQKLQGVTIGRDDNIVYSVWDDQTPAILYVYDAQTKELLASVFGYEKPLSVKIPAGHKDVIAGAAAYDGRGGRFSPLTSPASDLPVIEGILPEVDITNQPEYVIETAKDDLDYRIYMNGAEIAQENGAFLITLSEGENTITAFAADKSGHTAASAAKISLDTVPPELSIESPGTSVKTTESSIFIQGYAEKDAFVTCDNEAVAMVSDCFSIEKQIPVGSSSIMISAADKAGNTTVYTIEANRSFWTKLLKSILILVLIAAAGVAAEAYLLIYRQRRKKKND